MESTTSNPSIIQNLDIIFYLDFNSLLLIQSISKSVQKFFKLESHNKVYWSAVSHSFSKEKGIYLHDIYKSSKRHFFDEIWASRHKWSTDTHSTVANFKIQIISRFRPGRTSTDKIALPLHQFLKVKRTQINDSNGNKPAFILGQNDPEEFLDPFMKTLMRQPVKLKTSGIIVERAFAIQLILRDRRDPTNGMKLTEDMLEPQEELAARIREWRRNKLKKDDIKMTVNEVKMLMDEGVVDPIILQALIEAERLGHSAKRAEYDSIEHNSHPMNILSLGPGDFQQIGNAEESAEVLPLPPEFNSDIPLDLNLRLECVDEDSSSAVPPPERPQEDEDDDIDALSRWNKRGGLVEASTRVLDINQQSSCVSLSCPGEGIKTFNFFSVFPGAVPQREVYEKGTRDLVASVLNGFNSCVLCYGQTGSGKTHTMFGPDGALEAQLVQWSQPLRNSSSKAASSGAAERPMDTIIESSGLVIRACAELFRGKDQLQHSSNITVSLSAQFVEIYNEQVVDLLSGHAVQVRRLTGELVGATESPIEDMLSLLEVLRKGHARKRFAATAMNERSSRSHTILVILVTQSREDTDTLVKSELHLVDLAGSERIKKSKAAGGRLVEAVGINSSLLILGRVISALTEAKPHVPYLDSRLTTILRRALGGNSRTAVVVSCRSDDEHGDETLQSLRFGAQCGMISNSTKQAAASKTSALMAIDGALSRVEHQLNSLAAKGKQHLDSYKHLHSSFLQLQRKRADLAVEDPL